MLYLKVEAVKIGDNKMDEFKVKYYFDGRGEMTIEANNEDEAREKFFNGIFSDEEEWGENYNIESVNQKERKI